VNTKKTVFWNTGFW